MIGKKIVCLANSRKHSGRCIAGKEVLPSGYGAWVRPTSSRPLGEISEEERRYEDGTSPRLLDIIEIPMIGAAPLLYQSENYVIDQNYYWVKTSELLWNDLKNLVDEPASLWLNGDSTYHGKNDRVSLDNASKLNNSLYLIKPENLLLRVRKEGMEFESPKRRVRGHFTYQNVQYGFIVTDPHAERIFLAKPDGDHELERTYLCISLGEPFNGACYKLIAAIISTEFSFA
jgi:hypothetical protein